MFDPATQIVDLPAPKMIPEVQDINQESLEILYYGQAPASLAGLVQMNVRLPNHPAQISNSPDYLSVHVGNFVSPLRIWMRTGTTAFGQ